MNKCLKRKTYFKSIWSCRPFMLCAGLWSEKKETSLWFNYIELHSGHYKCRNVSSGVGPMLFCSGVTMCSPDTVSVVGMCSPHSPHTHGSAMLDCLKFPSASHSSTYLLLFCQLFSLLGMSLLFLANFKVFENLLEMSWTPTFLHTHAENWLILPSALPVDLGQSLTTAVCALCAGLIP